MQLMCRPGNLGSMSLNCASQKLQNALEWLRWMFVLNQYLIETMGLYTRQIEYSKYNVVYDNKTPLSKLGCFRNNGYF